MSPQPSEHLPPPPKTHFGTLLTDRRKRDEYAEIERRRIRAGFSRRRTTRGVIRSLGLGLITGAADDDPSAIGTYASAGASFGSSLLWVPPALCPMMFTVVYLCGKVGQVTGQGLFTVIRQHYPRWILYSLLVTAVSGNIVEAAADIGGIAAAFNLLLPIPIGWIVVFVAAVILALQIWTSYDTIRNVFRWLALSLLAYVAAAILARPDWREVVRSTLIPSIHFDKSFLAILLALVGSTLSAYLYSWQSNLEIEEQIAQGRRRLEDRAGAPKKEDLSFAVRDIASGMLFSSVIMFFVMLSTASTLYKAGIRDISTAAQAAQALRPVAGNAAGVLFALGIIGVGFLAVPVMTTGAAYDIAQSFGWRHGLHWKASQAKRFYGAIVAFTVVATCMNFFGINPMRALVYAGIVQGFTTPFLTLIVMRITNNRRIVGQWVNTRLMNVLGWITTAAMFAAAVALLIIWLK